MLVDTLIFEAVLCGLVQEFWFHQEGGVCRFSEAGRRRTLEMWVAKAETPGREGTSARILMREEALAVERHVLSMGEYKPFVRSS